MGVKCLAIKNYEQSGIMDICLFKSINLDFSKLTPLISPSNHKSSGFFFTLIAFFKSPAAASETKQTQRLRDEGALFVASKRQLNNIEHSSLYFLSEKQQHVHVLL